MSKTKDLTLCALLTALALALSWVEGLFPPPVPLPGVKLGLANLVTLFALCRLGPLPALSVLTARVLLGSMFAGNVSALLYSLLGALAAWCAMALLSRCRRLSVYGVCVGGAAAHNCGQIAAALLLLGSAAPLVYLPALLLTSLFTGAVTGFLSALLFRALDNTEIMKP